MINRFLDKFPSDDRLIVVAITFIFFLGVIGVFGLTLMSIFGNPGGF